MIKYCKLHKIIILFTILRIRQIHLIMTNRLLFCASLIFPVILSGQNTWTNYTTLNSVYDVFIDNETIWVGSQGGLTSTNIETNENTRYLAGNSPIMGGGVTSIAKAPDGGMWFGSYNAGLFEYKDGEWTNYHRNISSINNLEISNIEILANGDVLFLLGQSGTSNNKLGRLRDGNVHYFVNISDNISSFKSVSNDIICAVSRSTIFKYDLIESKIIQQLDETNSLLSVNDNLRHIEQDKNGDLIIPSANRILKLRNDELSLISSNGKYIFRSFTDHESNVYLSNYGDEPNNIRLLMYDGDNFKAFNTQNFSPLPVDSDPVFCGIDSKGRLYANMYSRNSNNAIYRYDEDNWTPVNASLSPMQSNYQVDVEADCNGNLWFTNRSGVDVRYADGSWEQFVVEDIDFRHFIPENITYDPLTCDMWFANESNGGGPTIPGVIKISDGVITDFLYDHDNVHALASDGQGKIYFYSSGNSFGYIENDKVTLIEEFKPSEIIYSMDSDSEGNIYLAGWEIGLVKYDGNSFEYLGSGDGSNKIWQVIIDNDDLIWARTSSGLFSFDGLNWEDFSDIWPRNTMNDMVQDAKGNYWVSTWYNGLYYWNNESLQHYHIFNSGLTSNNLRGVNLDLEGNLIVSQQVGVTVFNIPSTNPSFKGKGMVFFDADQNGEFDETIDTPIPSQKVKDISRDEWSVSNSFGTYRFYSDIVSQSTFKHELEKDAISTTGNTQTATINGSKNILPNFGFWKEFYEGITISITNSVPVCNREYLVSIYIRNDNYEDINGDLTITHNGISEFIESSIPVDDISNSKIKVNNLTIPPLRSIKITLTMQAPGIEEEETILDFDVEFGTAQANYEAETSDIVLCSYDPNDKKVEPTGDSRKDFSLIKDPLKYTIRFQNEGTYKAFDVAIIDTLDSDIDPSSFELVTSSHPVNASITETGIITFFFPDIDLPHSDEDEIGSQGFVTYTVKAKNGVDNFTIINNTASIYFDFNPPIVTNTTEWNLVDDLSLVSTKEVEIHHSVSPNPTTGNIVVTLQNEAKFSIIDLKGRLVKEGNAKGGKNLIDLILQPGIYIINFNYKSGYTSSMKLVVI